MTSIDVSIPQQRTPNLVGGAGRARFAARSSSSLPPCEAAANWLAALVLATALSLSYAEVIRSTSSSLGVAKRIAQWFFWRAAMMTSGLARSVQKSFRRLQIPCREIGSLEKCQPDERPKRHGGRFSPSDMIDMIMHGGSTPLDMIMEGVFA